MERHVIAQARQEFFNHQNAIRLVNTPSYGEVYRLAAPDLNDEARKSIAEFLRREGIEADVAQSKIFRGAYVQMPKSEGRKLHDLIARLNREHESELLETGEWLARKEGWTAAHASDGTVVMRLDGFSLSREQQDALLAYLKHHNIDARRAVSKTLRMPYIEIASDSVAAFNKLRGTGERMPAHIAAAGSGRLLAGA